jgi:hypothetical protein
MLALRISAFLAIAFGAISGISLPTTDSLIQVEARNYNQVGEHLQVRDAQFESLSARYVIFYDRDVSVGLM